MKQNPRRITYELLIRILINGSFPDLEIRNYFKTHKHDQRTRKFITEIVYGVIRWKLKLSYILYSLSDKKIRKRTKLLLMISLYQILYLDSVPEYAVVNESVEIAKKIFGNRISSFVNAVLRKILENKDDYNEIDIHDSEKNISLNYSFPEWMINYWCKTMDPQDVKQLCNKLNTRPQQTFRINKLKTTRDRILQLESLQGKLSPTNFSPYGLYCTAESDNDMQRLYKNGFISIQNEASQLISIILDPRPGEYILDMCSAPGTKSTHIAELTNDNANVISCDIHFNRIRLLSDDLKRLGINSVRELCVNSSILHNVLKCSFDRILVDAPCSGLGTIRSNPDIKWNRNYEDIKNLESIQYSLLKSASKLLKKDGLLLYSVCTISYLENEHVVSEFLSNHANFKIDKTIKHEHTEINRLFNRKGYFTTFDNSENMDGFFAVKFIKTGD